VWTKRKPTPAWVKERNARAHAEAVARRATERQIAKTIVRDEIIRRVTLGESLITVCREDKWLPSYTTVLKWMRADPDFDMAYKQAVRDRGDVLFEEALSIADDARNDWMARNDPENPGWIANGEHIQRSRLRVDTRKWAAAKLNPAKYGDKLAVEGSPDKPVVVAVEHRIVRTVQHETLPPLVEGEKKIDGWDDDE
jgi:hypothetical protein